MENPQVCRKCGGACCKNKPGVFAPEQFVGIAGMQVELARGDLIVGYFDYESDSRPRVFYLRPRMEKESGPVEEWWPDPSPCVYLTQHGCRLSYEARPRACQVLVPNPDLGMGCKGESHWESASRWNLPELQDFLYSEYYALT